MELPTFLQIEPVGQCNLRCRMCPIQFRHDGPPYGPAAFMEFADFTRVLEQFSTLKELHLQGLGEPMMHPQFFEMVRYAAQRGIEVSTNSNLTLLTPERAELCVQSGLSTVHISIDGATRQTYEFIRVGAHFKRVLRNVKLLLRAREKLQSATPRLRLVAVAMRRNLSELPALVRLAGRLKFPDFFVQHLAHDFAESTLPSHYRPMRQFVQEQTLLEEDPSLVQKYFTQAQEEAQKANINLRLPQTRVQSYPPNAPGRQRCQWPWKGMYLSYQTLAMPCCMVATPDRVHFGKAAEQGVEKTWNGNAYEDFRRRLDSAEPPEICKTCALYNGTF